MQNSLRFILPFVLTLSIILLFHFTNFIALKFYPVVVNFFIFIAFFSSLFTKQTIIQKFAALTEGKELDKKTLQYTRNLTYIWVIFTLLNFLISILTLFMSEKIWALYNGLISYILIGSIFAVEYPIRLAFRRKNNL